MDCYRGCHVWRVYEYSESNDCLHCHSAPATCLWCGPEQCSVGADCLHSDAGHCHPDCCLLRQLDGSQAFYILALALFTAGSALCGLAWSLPILIFFRVVQAVGGACLFPLAVTMLYSEFPPQQRGLASGLLAIAALLGPAVGPTLGGYFVADINWHWIFFINVPVGLLGILFALLLLQERRAGAATRFDVPGFLLVAAGLSAVLYGLSAASSFGWGCAGSRRAVWRAALAWRLRAG